MEKNVALMLAVQFNKKMDFLFLFAAIEIFSEISWKIL